MAFNHTSCCSQSLLSGKTPTYAAVTFVSNTWHFLASLFFFWKADPISTPPPNSHWIQLLLGLWDLPLSLVSLGRNMSWLTRTRLTAPLGAPTSRCSSFNFKIAYLFLLFQPLHCERNYLPKDRHLVWPCSLLHPYHLHSTENIRDFQ